MTVGKLSLGSAQWGQSYGISNSNGQTKSKEVTKILIRANLAGIHLIDTATSYGNAESVLGKNNLSFFSIVTKSPKFMKNSIAKSDAEKLNFKFLQSLKRLNQSSCYGFLIHQLKDIFKDGSDYLIEALNNLKFQGLVKKIGVSVYDPCDIDKIIDILKPDIIQLPLNILDQRFINDGTINYIKSKNIEIHARSVFLQGLLLMSSEKIPTFFNPWSKKLKELNKVCIDKNINPISAALNFVLKNKDIDYCLVGVENIEQLEQCISVSNTNEVFDFSNFACNDYKLINPSNWII